jgi:putative endonuclease
MTPSAKSRRRAHRRGHAAEAAALVFLMLKGYRPLARRFSAAGGEVDLVVQRGGTIAFVEVKARGLIDDALLAITATKRRRFSRAARVWLSRHPGAAGKTWRADAIYVAPWRLPRHVVAAFEIEMPG